MRKYRDFPVDPFMEKYRDMFMLGFYLIGINLSDLLELPADCIKRGRIQYRRNKTGRLYDIKVEPEAMEIIKKYKGKNHLLCILDITDDNLRDLTEKIQELYAPNSSRTICATIKAVIRENDEKGIRSSKFDSILRVKRVPVQAVYLTDNEIQSLINYIPHGSVERYVKRMFILECLCGARLSDCHNITPENIDDTGKYIVYVAQKTKAEVKVPLHKKLRPFLVCGTADEPVGGVVDVYFNKVLREICSNCGIDTRVKVFKCGKYESGPKFKFVSSHTGRRSFATNLSKKGVPVEQIAIMMGHANGGEPNIEMTQRYIVGKTNIDTRTLRVFGIYDDDYNSVGDEC